MGVPGAFTKVYVEEGTVALKGTDPNVTGADIKAVIEAAEKKLNLGQLPGVIIHSSPAWFVVDSGKKTLEPVGLKGRELSALVSFVVADKFFVDEVNSRLTSLGLTVNGFYSTVAGEAMLFLPEEDRDRTSVLIDMGYLTTDVMAVEGDALMFLKTIDMGGGNISADLAMGLIAEEIQQTLEESGIRLGQWSKIYLTGGGIAFNKGAKEYLGSKLGGRTVRDIPKHTATLSSHAYSSALGLMDLIISTLEHSHQEAASSSGALRNFFRELLGV